MLKSSTAQGQFFRLYKYIAAGGNEEVAGKVDGLAGVSDNGIVQSVRRRAIVGREGEIMTDGNRYLHPSRVNRKRPKWLEELSDSKAEEAIRKEAERIRNAPEPPPTLEEVQAIWARALGDRTTADLLDEIRGKPFPDRSSQSSE